jgi:hypothetical protein
MEDFDLDTPMLKFRGDNPIDYWTIRQSFEGTIITGSVGSGKTSGSGRLLAIKFLEAGFGGLVLVAKTDEKQLFIDYCKEANRSEDLIVIEPGGKHRFNFLEYEALSKGTKRSLTSNIVDVLKTVLKASQEKSSGKTDDAFWETSTDLMLFNICDLCKLAYNRVTVQDIYEIAQSIPHDVGDLTNDAFKDLGFVKALNAANKRVSDKLDAWERKFSLDDLAALHEKDTYATRASNEIPEFRTLNYIEDFFKDYFIPLNEKTRSIIEFSLIGFLFRFLREPVFSLFCNEKSTIEPEDCLKGKIILVNLPVKTFDKVGRDAQIMFKYIWQRAMERRDPALGTRPVFLWSDEAQNFIHEHDATYQATARSSRIATVLITQNLANFYANMGGERSKHRVMSLLGTLNTKIFHGNADVETNQYASALIGDYQIEKTSVGSNVGVENISRSTNTTTEYDRLVRPEMFASLKTGGPCNDFIVEGYFYRQGNPFSTGRNIIKAKFNQKFRA